MQIQSKSFPEIFLSIRGTLLTFDNILIEVDINIIAGVDIEDAIIDAKKLANKLGSSVKFVTFKFNETHIAVSRFCDIDKCVKAFRSGKKYIGS